MDYKKKMKRIVISIQIVTLLFVCGCTYWNMNDIQKPMEFSEFENTVEIEKTVYKTDAVVKLRDEKNKKEQSKEKAKDKKNVKKQNKYTYSFVSAERDQILTDISGFGEYKSDKKLKKTVLPAEIEGFKIVLPYNVHWHCNDDLKSLLLLPDTFDEESTIVLDTTLTLKDTKQTFEHQLNPKTEKETLQKIHEIYQTKSNYHYDIAKKQQLLFTVISGLIAIVVFLIFHFLVFRKYFKK